MGMNIILDSKSCRRDSACINDASPAAQYLLRLLPGAAFTDLPMLCWQPVSFQIAFPETEVKRLQ